jgi:hypothetical protein
MSYEFDKKAENTVRDRALALYAPESPASQVKNSQILAEIETYYPHVRASKKLMERRLRIGVLLEGLGLAAMVHGLVSSHATELLAANVEMVAVGSYEKRSRLIPLHKHATSEQERVDAAIISLTDPFNNPNATPMSQWVINDVDVSVIGPLAMRIFQEVSPETFDDPPSAA